MSQGEGLFILACKETAVIGASVTGGRREGAPLCSLADHFAQKGTVQGIGWGPPGSGAFNLGQTWSSFKGDG